jgi:hypothetical protein
LPERSVNCRDGFDANGFPLGPLCGDFPSPRTGERSEVYPRMVYAPVLSGPYDGESDRRDGRSPVVKQMTLMARHLPEGLG